MTSLRFMCRLGSASQLGRTQWEDSRLRRTTESRLWCSIGATEREREDKKDREGSEWKRKRLKRGWPWFATLGAFTKYGEQMFNVVSYLSGRAERPQSDQSFYTRWPHQWQPDTLFKSLETSHQLGRTRSSETDLQKVWVWLSGRCHL